MSGVSYLAQLQWRVAELNPPHLAAINPWEGWTDTYREVATHGGIPDTHFWPTLWNRWGAARGPIEDLEAETKEHPLYDDFWRSKAVDFSKIKTPAFVVASWTDQGLHTRGTFEGFKRIASRRNICWRTARRNGRITTCRRICGACATTSITYSRASTTK